MFSIEDDPLEPLEQAAKQRSIHRIRRSAAFGALVLRGPREAIRVWKDVEMAEEAYRLGYR